MNTVAAPQSHRAPLRIYVPVTVLATVLVLVGFWPSYFGRLFAGTLDTAPIIHIHAAVYMGWLALVIAQGYLAASGRTALHVKWGRIGMAYGVGVVVMGLAVAFARFAQQVATGDIPRAQRVLFIPFTDMLVFSALLMGAWVYRRRPDIHKRLIIVATTMLIVAGVGRMPFWHGTRVLSFREVVPFLVVWLSPIYLAMAYDYYRRRIVHPVYVIGLLGLGLVRMRVAVIDSDAWLGFSGWLAKFFLSAAFVAVLGLGPHSIALASEPNLQPDKANIWGIWVGTGGYPNIEPRYRDISWPKVQFTPWGAAESKRLATPESMRPCNPFGPVNYSSTFGNFPFEIARTTTGLLMMYEGTSLPRRIYTDGRKHPEELDPTWLGHSVGHWEGDTLVIDTVGTNGRAKPINTYVSNGILSKTETEPRLPASEQLHLVERFQLVGDGRYLQNEITIEDPKTYKQPFTIRRYWQRRPDLQVFEFFCEEDPR